MTNTPENEEKKDEGGGRNQPMPQSRKRLSQNFSVPGVRPVKTIAILVAIIILLLFLMMFFGLGGGRGGKLGAGPSNLVNPLSPNTGNLNDPFNVSPPEESEEAEESEAENAVPLRRELTVSFYPSLADPNFAQEMMCRLEWNDHKTGQAIFRNVAAQNMTDFEFTLEKTIRQWRSESPRFGDVPVVSVRMTPFPGEGIYRKIESIVFAVDPKISMMRLEVNNE